MSKTKRQDSKGRNLRLGESQRKDGRYVYKYTDIFGKPQFVYAWKLVPTDCTYRVNLPVKTTVNSGFNVIKIAKMYSISNKKVTRPRLKNLDFLYLIV